MTTTTTATAEIMTAGEIASAGLISYAHNVDAAAKAIGVSSPAVRRECRALGVRKVAGRAIAGFVVWPATHTLNGSYRIALSYAE